MIRLDREALPQEAIDRFWSYVDKPGPDECWLWRSGKGAGFYWHDRSGRRCRQGVIRMSFLLSNEGIPDGEVVTHSCTSEVSDMCLNPAHLVTMTLSQRALLNVQQGRRQYAGDTHNAKITAEQVLAIRRAHKAGARPVDLALEFGIAAPTVGAIVRRRTWRHIPEEDE